MVPTGDVRTHGVNQTPEYTLVDRGGDGFSAEKGSKTMIRRYAAGAALGTAMVVSLTACAGNSGSTANMKLSAAEIVQQVSLKTANVDTFKVDVTGGGTAGQKSGTAHLTGQFRLRPTVGAAITVDASGTGISAANVQVVLLGDTIYVKSPMLSAVDGGKPWLKISTQGAGGQSFAGALQQAEQINPASLTKMFTSSSDVHKVGTETIDGVSTTHLAGSVKIADALTKLDVKSRANTKDLYGKLGTRQLNFDVWVGGDSLPRKISGKSAASDGSVNFTAVFSNYGSAVNIAAPPAGDIGTFSGLGH